jgi:general secretion pathway protein G
MGLPPGLGPRRDWKARRKSLESIERDAERQRRELGIPVAARLGRRPSFLVIAMLTLAVLGGALVTVSRKAGERRMPGRRVDTACDELEVLATALGLYRLQVGHYPTPAEGDLAALVADPGEPGWAGPYITGLVPDPWGRPYRYSSATTPPTLFSHGADRSAGTADDLHAEPADFEVDPALVQEWTREEPRRPTVEIGTAPPAPITSNALPEQDNP